MTLEEALGARHSVRASMKQPLTEVVVKVSEEGITFLNREGKLHIQLIQNESKAFILKLVQERKTAVSTNRPLSGYEQTRLA